MASRNGKKSLKKQPTVEPSNGLKLGDELVIEGVKVRVGHLNQGIAFCSPIADERDWLLFRGLCVFKIMPDSSVKTMYRWGGNG
jgi:hypothetical protein